jgi:hypothetical protein
VTLQLIFGLLLLLLAVGCTPRPKAKTRPPAPPPIIAAKPKRRHLTPQPGDMVIHNCLVMRDGKNSADCLCRHASDKIDSASGTHSLECKEGGK